MKGSWFLFHSVRTHRRSHGRALLLLVFRSLRSSELPGRLARRVGWRKRGRGRRRAPFAVHLVMLIVEEIGVLLVA